MNSAIFALFFSEETGAEGEGKAVCVGASKSCAAVRLQWVETPTVQGRGGRGAVQPQRCPSCGSAACNGLP